MKKLLYILLLVQTAVAQKSDISNEVLLLVDELRQYRLGAIESTISTIKTDDVKWQAALEATHWKYSLLMYPDQRAFPINKLELFEEDVSIAAAVFNLYYGDYIYSSGVDESISYEFYLKARSIAEELENPLLICEALKRMVNQVNDKQNNYTLLERLSKEYEAAAFDSFEKSLSKLHHIRAKSSINQLPYLTEFLEELKVAEQNDHTIIAAYFYKLIGVKYEVYANYLSEHNISRNGYEKSLKYYEKALEAYSSYEPANFVKERTIGIEINRGINYYFQGKHDLAATYLNRAKNLIPKGDNMNKVLYHLWYARNLRKLGKLDSAYFHKEQEIKIRRSNYRKKIDVSVAEINTQYQTAKNEKEKMKLQTNIANAERQKQYLIFGTSFLLLFVGLITLLVYKNTTKKRKLAEQQEEIQKQKVETLLKEQELTSIDAMIEGQEKERQRVANELHDDLGSLMATVKLHFNNIQTTKEDEALKKADLLLEQAYQKVRGIAHAKNSGVIANQGLVPAVQRMAKTITGTNKIRLEVHHFGLEERMENSLELSIFRMIQELVTNMIKHAEAAQGSIQLTQHEQSLNILIEDNGKGFDTSIIATSDIGMGLHTIEKRIEHLEGNFTVDSILGKGTSIIIDIPI